MTRKMTRVFSLLFITMVLTATVFASGEPETPEIIVWGDAEKQATLEAPLTDIIAAFERDNPGVRIQLDFAQTQESISVATATNALPDVFYVQGNKTPKMAEYVDSGLLLPLTNHIDTSRYSRAEIEYATIGDELYCAPPSYLDSILVYYNKAIFENLDIDAPNDWDEFVDICNTIADADLIPIALAGADEWTRAWPLFSFVPGQADAALAAVMDGTGTLLDADIERAFQRYADFSDQGFFGNDIEGVSEDGAMLAFANGRAAMRIDGTWQVEAYRSTAVDIGYFYIPNDAGELIAQASLSNVLTYAVNASTDYPEEAAAFVSFLSGQEAQQIMADATSLIPTVKDIEPRSAVIRELSNFDRLGFNIYSVLTELATETKKPNDLFLKDVTPGLLFSDMTGEEAVQLLHEAATY